MPTEVAFIDLMGKAVRVPEDPIHPPLHVFRKICHLVPNNAPRLDPSLYPFPSPAVPQPCQL